MTDKGTPSALRPPSVPEYLWDAIPDGLRGGFIRTAAIELRKGIHPADTIEELLAENGLPVPAAPAPAPAVRPVPARVPPPLRGSAGPVRVPVPPATRNMREPSPPDEPAGHDDGLSQDQLLMIMADEENLHEIPAQGVPDFDLFAEFADDITDSRNMEN